MSMPSGVDVLMTVGPERWSEAKLEIEKFVSTGGVWFHLLEASETELPDVFGVRPGPVGLNTELRVEFADSSRTIYKVLPLFLNTVPFFIN